MNVDQKIAVIIINWKKYEFTLSCINSVLKSSYKNFKIILIDNESQKDFPDEINKSDKIHIIKNKNNEGFARSNNQGIKYSIKNGFDYVLLLAWNHKNEVLKKEYQHTKKIGTKWIIPMPKIKIIN